MASPSISAVIPVYNEAPALAETVRRVAQALRGDSRIERYEIILVDDGSTDNALSQVQVADPIRVLRHENNRGYGASLKTGITQAAYPWIMICDADGSYAVEELPRMLEACAPFKMIVAERDHIMYTRAAWAKRCVRGLFGVWLLSIAFRVVPDVNSGFRLFEKEQVLPVLGDLSDRFSFTTGLTLHWLLSGRPVVYIPSRYTLRKGESKVRFLQDSARVFLQTLRFVLRRKPWRLAAPLAAAGTAVWAARSLCR